MVQLNLPHRVADYLCPVNGLADVFEWKTGTRIPDEFLHYARSGFLFLSQKNAVPPKMVFLFSCSIGKAQYQQWARWMGCRIHAGEGKTFHHTLEEIRSLLDRQIPVILFGLDMFHLGYQHKFYHKVHIPGHIVLMVGYGEDHILLLDNSKQGVQALPFTDLEQAWKEGYLNISRGDAYFGIDFFEQPGDARSILQAAFADMADGFLAAPRSFLGRRGLDRLIEELPTWHRIYDAGQMKAICLHFIEFSGSVLPGLPKALDAAADPGIENPHKGTRDKFAFALAKYTDAFDCPHWKTAAQHFTQSGEIVQEIASGFCQDILQGSYDHFSVYQGLFGQLKRAEEQAYAALQSQG